MGQYVGYQQIPNPVETFELGKPSEITKTSDGQLPVQNEFALLVDPNAMTSIDTGGDLQIQAKS
jgi:hypothetical protein